MPDRVMIPWGPFAEPASSLSHLLGALLLGIATRWLIGHGREELSRRLALGAYLAGVGGMFLVSGCYHLVAPGHPWRRFLWHADHAMIWAAIVGTIAATYVLADLRPRGAVAALWAAGVVGMGLEQFALRGLAPWISPLLYIGMGWVGLFPFVQLVRLHGWRFTAPFVWAALTSTGGGIIDALEPRTPWPGVVEAHEVMHALILVSMGCFFVAIHRCARLREEEDAEEEPAPLRANEVTDEVTS